ncbi:MAG TPA: redox-regulated ATPase YchF [Desulfobacterales bacterium]|nr:redox-regulated ATPase YchF [Desulfobacterales bacterium]
MKFGIVGLPQAGKKTLFKALTGVRGEGPSVVEGGVATLVVHDPRVDFLSQLYKPKKTTYAKIEYLLPTEPSMSSKRSGAERWGDLRVCDALVHVVRNFKSPGGLAPDPERDFWHLEEEMILADLAVAEKRMQKLQADIKRGRKEGLKELELLKSCLETLEKGKPLRSVAHLSSAPQLRGFAFLSAKPTLVVVNNEDEDTSEPHWSRKPPMATALVARTRLEMEIAAMDPDEAEEFKNAYGIQDSMLDRIIVASFRLLDRITFFTVNPEEVRAWPIPSGTPALEAAGVVHSDMKKGFIRAEVISFEQLKAHGSLQAAKKAGVVRLEGKDYLVRDGDVIYFRFNV